MSKCTMHMGGFHHLEVDLGGIEKQFHLGDKFGYDCDNYPAWYVSVRSEAVPLVKELAQQKGRGDHITFHYGLTCSLEMGPTAPGVHEKLRQKAIPLLREALEDLLSGTVAANVTEDQTRYIS